MKTDTRTLSAAQYAYRRPARTAAERLSEYLRAGVILLAIATALAVLTVGVSSLLPGPALFVLGMVGLVSALVLVPFAAIKLVVSAVET
ncbi:hypothetical protein [Haladaptatus sp. DYSN1]|uniref:hypothetical protein n=1 Tax=unclassified Haladaptatus TaxID=2622732 RepID=UPI0024050542|nr:hypothetical protein [Haladaptatus sp. DYSN1]